MTAISIPQPNVRIELSHREAVLLCALIGSASFTEVNLIINMSRLIANGLHTEASRPETNQLVEDLHNVLLKVI